MRIEKITWQHRNDYVADMVCEHCAAKDVDKCGYNDANYHNNVIPRFYCQSCRKNRAGDLEKPAAHADENTPSAKAEPAPFVMTLADQAFADDLSREKSRGTPYGSAS